MTDTFSLLGLISLEPGSWADWFSGSMSALAVVVALSAYPLSNWQKRRDEKQREKDIGRAIGHKIVALLSQNADIDRPIRASLARRAATFPPNFKFPRVQPIGIPDRQVRELSQNEIDFLLRIDAADLLMEVDMCSGRYSSIVYAMSEYKARHQALFELMPSPDGHEGMTFTHFLNDADKKRVMPYMIMLDALLADMISLIEENARRLHDSLALYHTAMEEHFGKSPLAIQIDPPLASAAA